MSTDSMPSSLKITREENLVTIEFSGTPEEIDEADKYIDKNYPEFEEKNLVYMGIKLQFQMKASAESSEK